MIETPIPLVPFSTAVDAPASNSMLAVLSRLGGEASSAGPTVLKRGVTFSEYRCRWREATCYCAWASISFAASKNSFASDHLKSPDGGALAPGDAGAQDSP